MPIELSFFSDRLCRILGRDRSRTLDDAIKFADDVGYPVIVKPNRGSHGSFVWRADSPEDLVRSSTLIFSNIIHNVALVQSVIPGRDYRVVVLGDNILSAYERRPLSVCGNGSSNVLDLLAEKQATIVSAGRPVSEVDIGDPRIKSSLARRGLTLSSVIDTGVQLQLLDNANLSTGGDAIDITEKLNNKLAKIAIDASKTLGLTLCGVDIICDDATDPDCEKYTILELNGSPGLDNYASIGKEQQDRVDDMYIQILIFLRSSHI